MTLRDDAALLLELDGLRRDLPLNALLMPAIANAAPIWFIPADTAQVARNLGIGQDYWNNTARIADLPRALGIEQDFAKENARIADLSKVIGIRQRFSRKRRRY